MFKQKPFESIKYNAPAHNEIKLNEYFGDKLVRSSLPVENEIETIFICFTNRSGSNFLASYLASTGLLNYAEEIFNYTTVIEQSVQNNFQFFSDYCEFVKKSQAVNNRFLVKMSSVQLMHFADIGLLDNIFNRCRFIHIERSDLLSQAISFSIALQTGHWVADSGIMTEEEKLKYNGAELRNIIRTTAGRNAMFNEFFGVNGIKKFYINYEDFVKRTEIIGGELMAWLGIEAYTFKPNNAIKRQVNPVKAQWRERFLSDVNQSIE